MFQCFFSPSKGSPNRKDEGKDDGYTQKGQVEVKPDVQLKTKDYGKHRDKEGDPRPLVYYGQVYSNGRKFSILTC